MTGFCEIQCEQCPIKDLDRELDRRNARNLARFILSVELPEILLGDMPHVFDGPDLYAVPHRIERFAHTNIPGISQPALDAGAEITYRQVSGACDPNQSR